MGEPPGLPPKRCLARDLHDELPQRTRARPARDNLGPVAHHNEQARRVVAREIADVVEVDEVGAVDPDEALRVEALLERAEGEVDEVGRRRNVNGHVIVLGF